MLTFFRRIRKGLLASGATRKYILYAIGEVALVVIGILIALHQPVLLKQSVRQVPIIGMKPIKCKKKEIKIYKEILSKLEESLEDIEDDLEDLNRNLNASIKIRNMFIGQNV